MTRGWHIKDVYQQYREGSISFDDVMATAERGLAEYEQRRSNPGGTSRPTTPPASEVPTRTREMER